MIGGEERQKTRAFSELQSYYLFADKFGRPAKGNDKGKVEGLVGHGELSPSAYGAGEDHAGRRLHELACGGVRMSGPEASATNTAAHTADTPQLLLEHHLKELRLPTILREYDKVARQCAVEQVGYQHYLLRITELELLDRERRATERRIRQAKFPVVKTMDTFDFLAIPSLNKTLVLELARCEFLARRENVLLLDNSGTGKTHIALALGLAACQRGHRVRFTTTAALVSELIEALGLSGDTSTKRKKKTTADKTRLTDKNKKPAAEAPDANAVPSAPAAQTPPPAPAAQPPAPAPQL